MIYLHTAINIYQKQTKLLPVFLLNLPTCPLSSSPWDSNPEVEQKKRNVFALLFYFHDNYRTCRNSPLNLFQWQEPESACCRLWHPGPAVSLQSGAYRLLFSENNQFHFLCQINEDTQSDRTHLSLCTRTILSVCRLSLWEIRVLRLSSVSPRGTVSSTGLPVVVMMDRPMQGPASSAAWRGRKPQKPCCSIQTSWLLNILKSDSGAPTPPPFFIYLLLFIPLPASSFKLSHSCCFSVWQKKLYSKLKIHTPHQGNKPRPRETRSQSARATRP